REKDSWDRDDAAEALRGIGAYTTLGECLQDEDGYVRSYAFEALKKSGPAAVPAVPALIRQLEHPRDHYDVQNALQTLIVIGPPARDALPAIQALLQRGPQEQRPWFEAGEAIVQLTTPPEPADWAVKRESPPILSFDFENSLTEDRYRTRFEPLTGSVSYDFGPHSRCTEFNGKAGVLLEQNIDLSGGYTLEVAFRPSLLNQGQWREPAVLDCELFKIYPEGPWKYTVWLPNTKNLGSYAGCPMQGKPEWQHTAIVWNPYLHQWHVYANGKKVHDSRDYGLGYDVVDGVYKLSTTWPQSQLSKLALGCARDGESFWQGSIDDLKLYDYPRSPQQIAAAAAAFAERPGPAVPGKP
ncbi:MAG TPA: LamG-like jellyroll fold domain-containing protein, partial [Planctomycetota bacterium]|nr:LamG-like jellyroll fold domain-containing protein [Planctomycetota bacterium]